MGIIEEQLKLAGLDLSQFEDCGDTYKYTIEATQDNIKSALDIQEGMCYSIEVERYITKPYEGFTLHENWNRGIVPTDNFMNCTVNKIMGNMINVSAVGVTDGKQWEGWLPKKSIKVVKEI